VEKEFVESGEGVRGEKEPARQIIKGEESHEADEAMDECTAPIGNRSFIPQLGGKCDGYRLIGTDLVKIMVSLLRSFLPRNTGAKNRKHHSHPSTQLHDAP
jgi:hypothetical protein